MKVIWTQSAQWGVYDDDMTPIITGLKSNSEAWRHYDRLAGEALTKREETAEWLSRRNDA